MDANVIEVVKRHARRVGVRRIRWGRDDCVLWAAGLSRDLTGRDLLAGERWRSKREGKARIARDGNIHKALIRQFAKKGLIRAQEGPAPVGSFSIVKGDGIYSLAVKVTHGYHVRRVKYGVEFIPSEKIKACWSWAR